MFLIDFYRPRKSFSDLQDALSSELSALVVLRDPFAPLIQAQLRF